MVKVKICGITNLEDALAALKSGCDAVGFVFYRKSPRYISPKKAQNIISHLPGGILKVGVFVNAKEADIKRIAKLCKLSMLQFHGDETPEFCARFNKYKLIKAFRIRDKIDLKNLLTYKAQAFLFDAFVYSKFGGTGKKFNWNLLEIARGIKRPIFLSGGLNSGNVKKAMRQVHPAWVDVSSGVEIRPGKKDIKKLREFIKAAKQGRFSKQSRSVPLKGTLLLQLENRP